jgi:hypothetical protein
MATNRFSSASNIPDVTYLSLPPEDVDELQAEVGKADFDYLRIFVYDESQENAPMLDRSCGRIEDTTPHSHHFMTE